MSVETLLFAVAAPPTAHIPPPGTVVIAAKPLSPPVDGLGTETTENVPWTPCRTRGSWLPVAGLMAQPTTHVVPSLAIVTAKGSFSPAPCAGVGTRAREVGDPVVT